MKNITKYLFENIRPIFEAAGKDARILYTPDEALEFFGVEKDSDQGQFILKCYELAPKDKKSDDPEKRVAPFVAGYGSKKGFAMRRWVKDNPEIQKYMTDKGISPDSVFSKKDDKGKEIGFTNKGYHNTTLEKIDEFPNPSEEEYYVAMALNVKALGGKDDERSMRYSLFGDKYEDRSIDDMLKDVETQLENTSLSKKEIKALEKQQASLLKDKEMFDKYYTYYKDHKDIIDKRANEIDVKPGDLYTKLPNDKVKGDITSDWKENGNYGDKYPNYTPKTDIISKGGVRVSVKESGGAQAMSGGVNETAATLMTYIDLLDEETQMKLSDLFEDENGDPIPWDGEDKKRNDKLNAIIKDVFKNKEKNKKFIMAVIAESITGSGKFGKDSGATATSVITFNSDGTMFSDDVETYIYRTFQDISEKDVAINHKSSNNNSNAALRINLKPHKKKYDPIRDEDGNLIGDIDKDLIGVIGDVRENKHLKSKSDKSKEEKTEEGEVVDKKGNVIKVTIKTGPQGGKYYINSNNNRTYVQKGNGGKYEIRK